MPRPDGRIEPGQPLAGAISARAWNRAQDAADIVLGDSLGQNAQSGGAGLKPYTWAYCKSSVTVARWGVLAITGVEITPTSTESDTATRSFQDCPVLTGGTPSATTTAWCVAVEPIASGKIGRVAVSGVVQCKISVVSDMHPHVKCQNSTESLTTAWGGQAGIVWKQASSSGQTGWGLINLGQPHNRVLLNGVFYAPWQKDQEKDVDVGDGVTLSAENPFASITGTGQRACVIAYTNFHESTYAWRLIAAECT
jgi:hypothetical protein